MMAYLERLYDPEGMYIFTISTRGDPKTGRFCSVFNGVFNHGRTRS